MLTQRMGRVRSIDVVNELGYTKASVSIAMKKLRENGYIAVDGEERDEKMEELSDRKDFKEFLGHKPIEVLAGALLGILIAMLFPLPA